MRKLTLIPLIPLVCGCTETANISYENSFDGCRYSEHYDPGHFWPPWTTSAFGGSKRAETNVFYTGIRCEKIIEKELKDGTHKKQYNSVPALIEVPAMKVNIEK